MTQSRGEWLLRGMVISIFVLFSTSKDIPAEGATTKTILKGDKINAEVVYIFDGDSFVVKSGGKKIKVRLWGIDCPEYGQTGGGEAKAFLRKLAHKKEIILISKDRDKYGRLVAIAETDTGTLNEKMVKYGHAWVYTYYCKEQVCEKWKGLELAAREKRMGLWKNKNPTPPWMWKRKK